MSVWSVASSHVVPVNLQIEPHSLEYDKIKNGLSSTIRYQLCTLYFSRYMYSYFHDGNCIYLSVNFLFMSLCNTVIVCTFLMIFTCPVVGKSDPFLFELFSTLCLLPLRNIGCARDNLRSQKSLGPLKMSLKMAHKVIVPQKKIISRSFLNSGTLIVIVS